MTFDGRRAQQEAVQEFLDVLSTPEPSAEARFCGSCHTPGHYAGDGKHSCRSPESSAEADAALVHRLRDAIDTEWINGNIQTAAYERLMGIER